MIWLMVAIFTDARCLLHAVPYGFPERPERLRRILQRLEEGSWEIHRGEGHPAVEEAVLAVHTERYVERFRRSVERGDGLLDSADNPLSAGTWEAAWAAVETSLAAADWFTESPDRKGFVAVRPPGHHAERSTALGFCYLNNVAVAAEHLVRRHGIRRVAIFDFDVHHGNGTQHLFEERRDVFYASTHQYPFYPGTGAAAERGRGDGEGFTLNVPLPAGTDDAGLERAIQRAILPGLRSFNPEALLVSAGFDAWMGDPLGGMQVSAAGFARVGELLAELAAELCEGRMLLFLEGGYDLEALPDLVTAHLEALG